MKKYIIGIVILLIIAIVTGTLEETFYNTNELISAVAAYVQAICVILQSVLIYKQFQLSKEIEEKARAENKGIFVLDNTNIRYRFENEDESNNRYDLRKEISFHNIGNDHVIVKGQKINDKELEICKGTFFTNGKEYSKFNIDLNLSEDDLNKELLELIIELKLENLKGHSYSEIIEINFIREDKDSDKIYNLHKFNIRLE